MNPTEESLDFSFEGAVYVAPPGGPPFADTASLTTLLQEENDPNKKKDDEEEEVEAPTDPADPFPS